MLDVAKFVEGIHDYIARAFAPLVARVAALDSRQAERGEKGDPGERGADGIAGRDGAEGIAGKDGRDGIDGKDGAPGEPGPQGERGADGLPGPQGEPGPAGPAGERGSAGERGADGVAGKSITVEDVAPLLRDLVSAIPTPKDGKDGAPGEPGRAGADGKSVTPEEIEAVVERQLSGMFAKWALEFERRGMDLLQRTADRMPVPKDGVNGKDGRDAVPLDGFDATLAEDGRTVLLSLRAGETLIERSLVLPVPIDRGVYREGQPYAKGDAVSFGGSAWIAQQNDPPSKPGMPDSGWRLAVKAGRPGKDGERGKDYAPPAPVKL